MNKDVFYFLFSLAILGAIMLYSLYHVFVSYKAYKKSKMELRQVRRLVEEEKVLLENGD
jgi:hypothetical protein